MSILQSTPQPEMKRTLDMIMDKNSQKESSEIHDSSPLHSCKMLCQGERNPSQHLSTRGPTKAEAKKRSFSSPHRCDEEHSSKCIKCKRSPAPSPEPRRAYRDACTQTSPTTPTSNLGSRSSSPASTQRHVPPRGAAAMTEATKLLQCTNCFQHKPVSEFVRFNSRFMKKAPTKKCAGCREAINEYKRNWIQVTREARGL